MEDDASSSSGEEGDDMDEDMEDAAAAPQAVPFMQQQPRPEPVIDADGFELVQGRRRGKR
jgi:hypothetical protein